MAFDSLGEFINAADKVGEVQFVDGADLDLDVGGLTELTAERNGPMVVFDKFAGYPAGFRVAANANRTLRRFALAMDLPLDLHPLELLCRWRDKRADSKPISARIVKDGPILSHVRQGDAPQPMGFYEYNGPRRENILQRPLGPYSRAFP